MIVNTKFHLVIKGSKLQHLKMSLYYGAIAKYLDISGKLEKSTEISYLNPTIQLYLRNL